jgi:cytidylate kinase
MPRSLARAAEREVWFMAGIEEVVGRQIAIGELKRRLEPKGSGVVRKCVTGEFYRPCLLLSRKCGSGGTSLARLLGERLRWQIFDREIVEEVARSAHVRRQLIESVDERGRSGWGEFRRMLVEGEGVGRELYLHHLRHVILALGHHGDVIILGRGAVYILPCECAVRVRLVAPLELRARRVAERESIPLNRARRRVEQTDAERAAFIREVFGKDVDSGEDYDLVLDTGDLSLEAAAAIVLARLQSKLHVQLETAPCGK